MLMMMRVLLRRTRVQRRAAGLVVRWIDAEHILLVNSTYAITAHFIKLHSTYMILRNHALLKDPASTATPESCATHDCRLHC
eukprot:6188846-Pleurochrysis_carterae.AAC.5